MLGAAFFCQLTMMLALRQQSCRNVSRAKHWVRKTDLKSWRKLAVKPVWHGPGKMLGARLNGRLAETLAGRHARGWLKSLWLLALLAVWLSRGMAGVLAACGLVILACVQFLYSV
ncbi:hypothetical protein [Leisingera sp. M523]|uniref:hypothetical protein n=1 Tax=Leisingera sp. M523 TaxID=2867013 RepID=UPI0021A37E71|nr:hypothetical protein [Leisingera sp. M523]UWQ27582.1 hypothetical protein K3557_12260 [Leisingera sp. M523]